MQIDGLYLKNYRNIKNLKIDNFSPGINLFTGRNGSGKTNLLEALGMLGAGGLLFSLSGPILNWVSFASWLLIVPALTSFLGMNFTGASTYTSLSGVLKEMRVAVPIQKTLALMGLALWITSLFV